MPFGADNLAIPFYMRAMASPLLTGGGFQQAGREMQQGGAMPMMTPEQAMQMMQSPEMRQVLSQFGLHPIESGQLKQSPFFSQGFMQHHPRLGGALSGAMANIAMTPEAPLVSGAGSGMSRAMQGLAGGPEMLRRYQVGQIVAPEQQMAMMMPAYGAQVYKHMVDIWQGEQDRAAKLGIDKIQMENLKEQNRNLIAQGRLTLDQAKLTEKQLADKQSNEAKMANAQAAATRAQADLVKAQTAAQKFANKGDFIAARAKLDTWKQGEYDKLNKDIAAAQKAGTPIDAQEQQNRKQQIENSYASSMGILAGREIKPYQYPAIAPGGGKPDPPRPANVPEGYIFKWDGPKGAGYYNPKAQ